VVAPPSGQALVLLRVWLFASLDVASLFASRAEIGGWRTARTGTLVT
jgi:hypothetical protein